MSAKFPLAIAPYALLTQTPIVMWYAHRHVSMAVRIAHRLATRVATSAPGSYRYRHDEKVRFLGQAIDTQLFAPPGRRGASEPTVLSVGRIAPIKDPLTLVDATRRLRDAGTEVETVIVGGATAADQPYVEQVRRRIGELGLGGTVRLVGPVPNAN